MERNLINIADGIIKIINEECTFDEDIIFHVIVHIEDIKKSYSFRAPELQYLSWCELSEVLSGCFNPCNSQWEEKIRKLFADEISLDEI